MRFQARLVLTSVLLCGALSLGACATTSPSAPLTPPTINGNSASLDPMSTGTGGGSMNTELGRMMASFGGGAPKSRQQVSVIARGANDRPLGTPANPVRANAPDGQRAYIARLRCPGGDTPQILGRANIGVGIYGMIVDVYTLSCRGQANKSIALDMYHDWVENRPAEGFTISGASASPQT
jgi:hypothetical protein